MLLVDRNRWVSGRERQEEKEGKLWRERKVVVLDIFVGRRWWPWWASLMSRQADSCKNDRT